jgi:hypothetical protein
MKGQIGGMGLYSISIKLFMERSHMGSRRIVGVGVGDGRQE